MSERQSPPRGPAPERPRMGLTRPATLVVAGLAALAVAWLLISRFYGDIPKLPLLPTIMIFALAVFEAYSAANTRARVERRAGREPVDPLMVARLVVLAKASSLAGSILAGFYGGILGWLLIERTRAATQDIPAAAVGVAASLALAGAGLWLEWACRVPKPPEDDDKKGRSAGKPGR